MKFVTIIGARPQFVKAAAVSRIIRRNHQEILVHTGQHYDNNMSEIFFDELHIPKPDYNLGVGSGSHAKQTADMMIGIEEILLKEKPDYILVYGDTNSTLAGAIAATKIHIPIVHVEAGLRSFNMNMPEEQNRILTDRISKFLFCPTNTAVENLKAEGITQGVYDVGDVMCDAVLYYEKLINKNGKDYYFNRLEKLIEHNNPESWYLATIHRAENTDNIEKIYEILSAFEEFDEPVIFPVHPRTKEMVLQVMNENSFKNTIITQPVGYIDMLFYAKNAIKIVTDSGGLQKEAYILNTPCVTVRDQTEWVETLNGNHNILCKPNKKDIIDKVFNTKTDMENKNNYYGNGDASEKIINFLR
ncbi:non-hydrolyzing UDP-N-acetylglucosamine 2-epimerase [Clostridium uliginosum]|uniref:UDP-N-acetylglucosamine 2-epimerase (Non-hydrolysing)/UDP-GlcNAc3NAcA epimerase n=1 Tax=Clostridium uliginosum TaxID=119641 RepID=A0A1I1R8E2_9CLOT|nr:UDP-N-acetylglucosamine 2-epimerase (non-hydrolyzing) [Clostridium uliginosum]SFD26590.1 UDP-N-acetylglucosamine 2-epimerase (non-hydrolysing)/UDP-GlcNAc3NAcA epimerase [Clostridium uliginosum]